MTLLLTEAILATAASALLVVVVVARLRCQFAEAKFSAVLRSLPDFVFILDRQGTVLEYHGRAEEPWMIPEAEAAGRNVNELLPESLACLVRARLRRSDQTAPLIEFPLRAGNQVRHFEARFATVDEVRVLAIVRDITELRQMEWALQRAQGTRRDILHKAGHELRTPLNAIVGFTELLEDRGPGPLTPKQARFLSHVSTSARELLGQVERSLREAERSSDPATNQVF